MNCTHLRARPRLLQKLGVSRRQRTEVEDRALRRLGGVEAGLGDDAVEEAGPVLHAFEVGLNDDGELRKALEGQQTMTPAAGTGSARR